MDDVAAAIRALMEAFASLRKGASGDAFDAQIDVLAESWKGMVPRVPSVTLIRRRVKDESVWALFLEFLKCCPDLEFWGWSEAVRIEGQRNESTETSYGSNTSVPKLKKPTSAKSARAQAPKLERTDNAAAKQKSEISERKYGMVAPNPQVAPIKGIKVKLPVWRVVASGRVEAAYVPRLA
jgi:hypothetical protein